MDGRLLSVRDLQVWFPVRMGVLGAIRGGEAKHVRAVDGIDLEIRAGEVFCLVGESGCGKTTTGKAILRLNDATGGNILYRVPPEEMERLEAIERRLEELAPVAAAVNDGGGSAVAHDFRRVQRLKAEVLRVLYPWARVSGHLRREGVERSIAFLEDRARALREGTDPSITRMLAGERERLDLLMTQGPGATPRRVHALLKRRKELKEAKYALHSAEVMESHVGKARRRFGRAERHVKGLETRTQEGRADPQRIEALQVAVETRRKRLVETELAYTEAELTSRRAKLEALLREESAVAAEAGREFPRIQRTLEELRSRGGPALEVLELQALRESLIRRFDLTRWSPEQTIELRKRMQIIYQDPYESLNPKMSIFDIVSEPLMANKIVDTPAEAEDVVRKALDDVGLKPADEYMFRFPHELSGGQRQRVGIATALVVDPDFIMADEPVSMLDASVRTEILALLLDLKKRRNLTYLFITHDLGLAWIIADQVAVMYLGKVVEVGHGPTVIRSPQHPYTKSLISVVPSPNPDVHREKIILKGERPNPVDIPAGCRFHPRCPNAVGMCGWEAHEVREELVRLFRDESKGSQEAAGAGDVAARNPLELVIQTRSPNALADWLRKRIQAIALEHPALGAIRDIQVEAETLCLRLYEPKEPQLHPTANGVSVACHIVRSVEVPAGA